MYKFAVHCGYFILHYIVNEIIHEEFEHHYKMAEYCMVHYFHDSEQF